MEDLTQLLRYALKIVRDRPLQEKVVRAMVMEERALEKFKEKPTLERELHMYSRQAATYEAGIELIEGTIMEEPYKPELNKAAKQLRDVLDHARSYEVAA